VARLRFLALLGAFLGTVALQAADPTPSTTGQASTALAAQGRHVYERHCILCHGRWGDGRGDMARGMAPKPRRFTAGVFKYRSTPSGFLPTDADLARTIRGGIAGTSMPSFAGLLSQRDVDAVIETLKTFSSKWDHADNQAAALRMPAPPAWLEEDDSLKRHAAAAAPLFLTACSPCHGPAGRGNGPAAGTLENDWGEPTPPADLTSAVLRCGPGPEDIYRTLVTGLNGTPMPGFLEATTEGQRWDLVAWILTARTTRQTAGTSTNGTGNETF
jgi:mono/diheme cytochrome c family protein